jgi:crotonobetainyl-CoA:carnitine CoA-transferase CaiB-like acyl-CoA transferase
MSTLLSDLGADVIKVEPPDGDPWRNVPAGFMGVNRGKRGMAIDMKKKEAGEIIRRLIAGADVLIHNIRATAAQRMGIDYESAQKIKPDIIYVSAPSFGSKGPYATLPGFDPIMQSLSGQSAAQGGLGKPPVFLKVALNDQAAPMLAAAGIMMALDVRAKTGKGQHIENPLFNAALTLQCRDFAAFKGKRDRYLGDEDIRGINATQRLYQGCDGKWFFLYCANETHWKTLCQELGLEKLLTDPRFETSEKRAANDSALSEILADSFRLTTAAAWASVLQRAGIPASLSQNLDALLKDPHCWQNNMFISQVHPQWGKCQILGVVPRFSRVEGSIRHPSPLLGEHSEEILTELNYAKEQIAELKANRVIISPKKDS